MSIFRWTAPLIQRMARLWSEEDLRFFADRLRPYVPPGGVFADLGGGTGDLGAGLARALAARVVVVDLVPQMLERVQADPVASTRLASVETLPFPTDYFDGALCCDAFHHFRDQHRAAQEIARVVRPGGGVLVMEMAPAGLGRALVMLERVLGEPGNFRTAPEMESLLAAYGIVGSATPMHNGRYGLVGSYSFLGSVREGHD